MINDKKVGVQETLRYAINVDTLEGSYEMAISLFYLGKGVSLRRMDDSLMRKGCGQKTFKGLRPLVPAILSFFISGGTSMQAMTGGCVPYPLATPL